MTLPDRQPAALLLETGGFDEYRLVDSGNGRKLERFGEMTLIRPEEQAIWAPRLAEERWLAVDATFTGDSEEEGAGRWKRATGAGETWICRHGALRHQV